MSFFITVRFLSNSFSHKDALPSPSKIFGALLWGGYNLGDEKVISAVRSLENAPHPNIIFSGQSSSYSLTKFSAGNPMVDNESSLIQDLKFTYIPGALGGKTQHEHNEKVFSNNSYVSYEIDYDVDVESISKACERINFIGAGSDFVEVYVEEQEPTGVKLIYSESSVPGSLELSLWGKELTAYYDKKHFHIYEIASSANVSTKGLRTGNWVQIANTGEGDYFYISTKRIFKQKILMDIMKTVEYNDELENNPIPLIDGNGFIRGVAVPYDIDSPIVGVVDDGKYFDMLPKATPLRTQNIEYWSTPADKYISATPYFGHPDEFVAVFELQKAGFIVNRISATPFHHSQGTIANAMKAPSPYQRWWVELEGSSSGVVQLGYLQETGAGLFRPVHHQEDKG